jgi:putative FmdB family regulatory protein
VPTYQYACKDCGHSFEQLQSFTDDALTVCPVCEGRLRKVFNAVGVVFKGSGFYRTDSRTGSGEGNAASGTADTGSSTKADAAGSSTSTSGGGDNGTKAGASTGSGSDSSSGSSSTSSKDTTSAA